MLHKITTIPIQVHTLKLNTLTCVLFQGYDDLFKLNSLTKDGKPACQLQLLRELDYEIRPLYRLTITVTVRAYLQSTYINGSIGEVGATPKLLSLGIKMGKKTPGI